MSRSYDIAIVGSGLGGLACGYMLSKNGYKVAIFEKNAVIGGCLQTFCRKGATFETGMHYIGSMHKGEALYRFFNYFGLNRDLKLNELDTDGFDIISYNGKRYRFANGSERFIETIGREFPDQYGNLRRYMETIKKIAGSSPLYSFSNFDKVLLLDPEYVKVSVDETIGNITPDKELQNVLAGNMPLYAGVKSTTPMYVHALISDFYINSAFRIVGGSDAIATSLADSIKSFGGEIFTSSKVTKVLFSDDKVKGIRLETGEKVECKYMISDIHPELLIDMADTHLIRKAYKERIRSMRQTVSNFTVYIKFKANEMPYLNSNFFHYKSDVWGCENYSEQEWPRNFLYMHQCSEENQKFVRSAIVFAYMRWGDVEKWADSPVGRRGEEYEEFKHNHAERLLDELEKEFPGTRAKIEDYWTSTPLTYRDYTGTKEGSMYGIMRDKNFPTQTLVSQRTKVENMFLTGQNINSHGILGVIIGSIITCSEFIGLDTIIEQIRECQ